MAMTILWYRILIFILVVITTLPVEVGWPFMLVRAAILKLISRHAGGSWMRYAYELVPLYYLCNIA